MSSIRRESRLSLAYLASAEPHPHIVFLGNQNHVKRLISSWVKASSNLPLSNKVLSSTNGLGDFAQVPIIFLLSGLASSSAKHGGSRLIGVSSQELLATVVGCALTFCTRHTPVLC